jgi:prepilin-type N-terminal cleavage/methylation domain-containing protein
MNRRGFTLIELLVVIAIIGILAALLLPVISSVMLSAKSLATGKRCQDITVNLLAVDPGGDGKAWRVQKDGLGDDLRFASLHEVITRLMATDPSGFPPIQNDWASTGCPPNLVTRAGDINLRNREAVDEVWSKLLMHKPQSYPVERQSSIGENQQTLEVVPDLAGCGAGKLPTKPWYRNRWPHLTCTGDPATTPLTGGWPASTWNNDDPGPITPSGASCDAGAVATPTGWVRWSAPWGRPELDLRTGQANPTRTVNGAQVGAITDRSLADLSPLHSISLLRTAGVLPDETRFRSDRGTGRAWNDRWGNPLVVMSAVFVPLRHDFVFNTAYSGSGNGLDYEPRTNGNSTNDALFNQQKGWMRPRDMLLKAAAKAYGFNRAVYVAAGAAGPRRLWPTASASGKALLTTTGLAAAWDTATPLPTWQAGDDSRVLRGLWLQVRAITKASEVGTDAITNQTKGGMRQMDAAGGQRCFLTAPLEIQ